MPNQKSTLRITSLLILTLSFLATPGRTSAFAPEHYAESSALSEGQWAKVEVTETGMQFISDATLRNLGFSDPEKVNVYGYGGFIIPENLESPDDLPLVGSMRVNGGIVFFGKGSIGWSINHMGASEYFHESNPYSDVSYYFVSDAAEERKTPGKARTLTASGNPITVFTQRLLHEQDVFYPMESGRFIYGEDFKTNPARSFNFPLQGNTGDVLATIAFGCKTSSGTSTLTFTANGKQLGSSAEDKIASSDTKEIVNTTTIKSIDNPGTSLDLNIRFNGSGNVKTAGLDYIEIEYPRSLTINTGELYFYLSPNQTSEVRLEGATASTVVWDVTDAENPLIVNTTLSGNVITFVSESGYHEFVAFDPARISRAVIPGNKIPNQNLHAMEAPDMLVISPAEYLSAAQRLVDLHQFTDGLEVAVVTPEDIYNEFSSGKPDVSAFRKFMKMWYDRAEGREGEYPRYCVILSRPTYDQKMLTVPVRNCGYPRVPIWQSPTGESETTSYSTDDYIGMLADVNGSFNIGTAEIHVAVGRMPFKSLNEANIVMDKLEEYVLRPDLGSWRNNVMIIADDQDNGIHLEQAEKVVAGMKGIENGKNFTYEKLYLDSYTLEYKGTGATYPQAHERMMNKWNEGIAFIDYIGHANQTSWGHESMLTWTEINTMSNSRLPYIYAATCNFMRWDADDTSGAEILWLLPSSGLIGSICPSREVLITANGVLNQSMAQYIFELDENGNPLTAGDIMRLGKNNSNTGTNKLRYGLIGDPAMKMPWPNNRIVVDVINGTELESAEEFPILSARSTVTASGHIEDKDGNPITDFNGIAEISLYDAEKVITTNGNGADGVQSMYNDRKTRLYIGRVKVTDGQWSTTFMMPSEIENNYQPALISLYASDDQGREANGHSEKLYAFGYDDKAPDDFEGPKIIEFYLDTPSFENGNHVSPNPILYAKFRDESGISVSEAGIGHNISLQLDNKTFFDDVAQYYLPDAEEAGAGSVTYNLTDVGQGSHTLSLTVWDNANNSTTATLDFSISALWKPSIETLTTDVNPATSNVNFIVATDGSTSSMDCSIEVYDLWGKRVWRDQAPSFSKNQQRTSLGWNLCDFSGARVPGGVYLYRATVKTDTGATVAKTKKLIVRGQ